MGGIVKLPSICVTAATRAKGLGRRWPAPQVTMRQSGVTPKVPEIAMTDQADMGDNARHMWEVLGTIH
jgi:hypothetical protein